MFIELIYFVLLMSLSYQYIQGGELDSVLDQGFGSENENNNTKSSIYYCLTESGDRGECIPYYLCAGGVASTDGSGVIDLRMGEDLTTCTYLNQCCLPPNIREVTNPIKPVIKQRKGCGWTNSEGLGFRMTGNKRHEAEFGEFPWMVAVLSLEPMNKYIGGGSLIHPSVVLTAAHIVNSTISNLKVRAGDWDTLTDGELYPYQERLVTDVDVHEKFNKANLFYDIALLYLAQPMDLAPNVALACIPRQEEYLKPDSECFATGWGKDRFGQAGQYQNILKKVDLRLVDRDNCERMLRGTRLQKYFELHLSFMCAGGEANKDMCTGDGGSPLVCPVQFEQNRYKQVGIVAWGIGCGLQGVPAVYTDVSIFNTWLDKRISQRGYETSVYRSY